MKSVINYATLLLSAFLASCSGEGNGVGSTPTPTPAPTATPTPPASPLAQIVGLITGQTAAHQATTTNMTLQTPGGILQSASESRAGITLSYDAVSKSYSIATGGRTQIFVEADLQPQRLDNEVVFSRQSTGASNRLTLTKSPYSAPLPPSTYVALGYWQQNALSSGLQQTYFSTFVFGRDTPQAAIPRNGSAHWLADFFGLFSIKNQEVRTIQGSADFDVDFAAGAFRLSGDAVQYDFISGGGISGSIPLQAGGSLSSDGSFTGELTFTGSAFVAGVLTGNFYGPNAEEIGATFNAERGDAYLTGALTGQRSTMASSSSGIPAVTLTDVAASTSLHALQSELSTSTLGPPSVFARSDLLGSATVGPTGVSQIADSQMTYTVSAADKVADARPNFASYKSVVGTVPVAVSLYKIGPSNTELALTYTSFGSFFRTDGNVQYRDFLLYGIKTQPNLLAGRTGTGSYAGVVLGAAASLSGRFYDLSGTSHFEIDFSAQRYTGALDLTGTAPDGARSSVGRFTFGSTLFNGGMLEGRFDAPADQLSGNSIRPEFFGTNGQEVGAVFSFYQGPPGSTDQLAITGVAVAKRQ